MMLSSLQRSSDRRAYHDHRNSNLFVTLPLVTVLRGNAPEATTEELLQQYLQEGEARFQAVTSERRVTLPEHGAWEVALLFMGQIPVAAHKRNPSGPQTSRN